MVKRKDAAHDAENAHAKKIKPNNHSKMSTASRRGKLVESTNALSNNDFRSRFVDQDILQYKSNRTDPPQAFDISLVAADYLTPGEYNACYSLIEQTSRSDYESSSFGWHPRRKRKEMLEPEMKYLLVRRTNTGPMVERTKETGDVDISILAFLSFMVDYDSSPSAPVLYIYEIHLVPSLRGLGLGDHLMQISDRVAQNVGLDKVMLTCFLSNQRALRFYTDHGFAKDACSPDDRKTRNKVVPVDYVIMSKDSDGMVPYSLQAADDHSRAEKSVGS